MTDSQKFHEQAGRIESVVHKLEAVADPSSRATARELVQSVMDLHGAGLSRILELAAGPEAAAGFVASLASDPLVGSLLILHGLHPEDFETRVRRALDKVRPALHSQDARAEIIAIADESVHLSIYGHSRDDLQALVREALFETAPDAVNVIIDGGLAQRASSFVPLASLRTSDGAPIAQVTVP